MDMFEVVYGMVPLYAIAVLSRIPQMDVRVEGFIADAVKGHNSE